MDDRLQAILQQATEHLRKGDADATIECLSQLGARVTENYEAAYLLGVAHGMKRRLNHSLSCLAKAVELKPDFVPARYNLAVALQSTGDVPKAIAHLKEVLRQQPQHQQARTLLAQLTRDSAPHSPAEAALPCPECGNPNPAGYIRCSMCGAMSADALKRKEAEAAEKEHIDTQVTEPAEQKQQRQTVRFFYAVVGAIAAVSILFEVWWLVILKRHFGDSIGIALLMTLLTLIAQAVVPFLVGLVWFSLAWWVEDKSKVIRASLMLGAACLIVEVAWRLVLGPTIGMVLSFIPFGNAILSFCLFYLAVMFVLEREIKLRLDASYGAALWLTIAVIVASFTGSFAVNLVAEAVTLGKRVAAAQTSDQGVSADIPTYPGAQSENAALNLPGVGRTVSYRTSSQSLDEVASFFKTEMSKNGWTLTSEQNTQGTDLLLFSQQSRQVQVLVMASNLPIRYTVTETGR